MKWRSQDRFSVGGVSSHRQTESDGSGDTGAKKGGGSPIGGFPVLVCLVRWLPWDGVANQHGVVM